MAKKIPIERPTENWTKFPNCILDNLEYFTPAECKILNLMVRKNIGYTQPNKKFAIRYFEKKLNMARGTVITAVRGLLAKKSIKVSSIGERGIRSFDINWKKPVVQKLNRSKNSTTTGLKTKPDLVQKLEQVKDNNKKNNNRKKTDVSLRDKKGGSIMKLPGLSIDKPVKKSGLAAIVVPKAKKYNSGAKIGTMSDCHGLYLYVISGKFNAWDEMLAGDVTRLIIGLFSANSWKHSYTYRVLASKMKNYIKGKQGDTVQALLDVYRNPGRYNNKKCIGYLFDGGEDYLANPLAILSATNISKVVKTFLDRKAVREKSKGADQKVISYVVENMNYGKVDKDTKHAIQIYVTDILTRYGKKHKAQLAAHKSEFIKKPREAIMKHISPDIIGDDIGVFDLLESKKRKAS